MDILPSSPGLARRLAYGEFIRRKRFRNLSITGRGYNYNYTNYNNYTNHYTNTDNNLTYEQLVELEPVKIGLDIKNINSNSFVYTFQDKLVLHINICIICQEFFKNNNEIIRELSCCHPYHLKCIDRWFEENTFCPICKHDFN